MAEEESKIEILRLLREAETAYARSVHIDDHDVGSAHVLQEIQKEFSDVTHKVERQQALHSDDAADDLEAITQKLERELSRKQHGEDLERSSETVRGHSSSVDVDEILRDVSSLLLRKWIDDKMPDIARDIILDALNRPAEAAKNTDEMR